VALAVLARALIVMTPAEREAVLAHGAELAAEVGVTLDLRQTESALPAGLPAYRGGLN
jgi:hypothetical protein